VKGLGQREKLAELVKELGKIGKQEILLKLQIKQVSVFGKVGKLFN